MPRYPWTADTLVVFDIGPLRPAGSDVFLGFLAPNGRFVDNCGARPCYAAGWTGP
jgi:hypothetical protein